MLMCPLNLYKNRLKVRNEGSADPKMIKLRFVILCIVMILSVESLIAQRVVEGQVESRNSTTIDCQVVVSYQEKFQPYRFVETYDSAFGYKRLYPDQISGYSIKGESYRSIIFKEAVSEATVKIFARVISEGKATLLYSPIFHEVAMDIFFFRRKGEEDYHMYRAGEIMTLGDAPYKLYAFNEEQVFSGFFSWYLQDCAKVARAAKERFYTIGTIENLFKDYNNCF